MNINTLSKIASGKHAPTGKLPVNSAAAKITDFFKGSSGKPKLGDRVSDSIVYAKLRKLTDDNTELKKENKGLNETFEEQKEKSATVEEYFKKELGKKDEAITTLLESIKVLQEEKPQEFNYDILTKEFSTGDFKQVIEPPLAALLAEILTQIPQISFTTNYKVKDSLSLLQKSALEELVSAITTALDGNLEPLEDFDISELPEDLIMFAKDIKAGKPYVTNDSFIEGAPIMKSYLETEAIEFPELAKINDI